MKCRLGFAALALSLFFGQSAFATSIDIVGGETQVKLTSLNLFASLGLDLGLVGSATISGSVVTFPVTGGNVDMDGFAMVEHDGSGITIADDKSIVSLENFLIDTREGTLFGDVSVDGDFLANIGIFEITSRTALLLTDRAADALSAVFNLDIKGGTEIGVAEVKVQLVPIPGAAILMISGLLGLVGLRRTH